MIYIEREKLKSLSPTAFENLVFDLARRGPLTNLHWRTPGADGGRDIEGEIIDRDFSGHLRLMRWLIECKRYSGSIGWPVLWEKVAYADTAQADFLLVVSTSTFTPRCLDEVAKWNAQSRKPAIRLWPLHELEFRLGLDQSTARKFGLIPLTPTPAATLADLSLHVARMSQAAIASAGFTTISERHLFAASCLAELLFIRSVDLDRWGEMRTSPFLDAEILPEFVTVTGPSSFKLFDRAGLRAILACLNLLLNGPLVIGSNGENRLAIKGGSSLEPLAPAEGLLNVVGFWSGITVERRGDVVCLTRQISD